jgi:mono/diheme cytochrome c family protein
MHMAVSSFRVLPWFRGAVRSTNAGERRLGAAAPAQTTPPPGNAENGKATYNRVGCYECHGLEAQGGPGTAPRLGPNPLPFPRFSAYIRKPTGTMPPYRLPVLSDQEAADIHAFLRAQPRPPALSSIPLLAPSQFK